MKYAKLVNGNIRYAPDTVKWTDESGQVHTVNNPDQDKLLELEYLPVHRTEPPDDAPDGKHYESSLEQAETEILQRWRLVDDPVYPDPEPTMSELEKAVEDGRNK